MPVEACPVDAMPVLSEIAWIVAGGASALTALFSARLVLNSHSGRHLPTATDIWVGMGDAARRLAAGESELGDAGVVVEALSHPDTGVDGLAAVVAVARSVHSEVHPDLFDAVAQSSADRILRRQLDSDDPHERANALETVASLRVLSLVGDVANAALDDDESVVQAAINALIVVAPQLAVGLLSGRVRTGDPWTVEALGRALDAAQDDGIDPIAVERSLWEEAPALAERALIDGSTETADALAAMTDLLHHERQEHRLSAIRALSKVEHPSAQIALLGALDADDRVTRFAAASRLADTEEGRVVLRHYSEAGHGSDAGEAASLVLWSNAAPVAPVLELKSVGS